MRVSKMAQQKTPEIAALGFFYSVLGGLNPRLATNYLSPSSHLQI